MKFNANETQKGDTPRSLRLRENNRENTFYFHTTSDPSKGKGLLGVKMYIHPCLGEVSLHLYEWAKADPPFKSLFFLLIGIVLFSWGWYLGQNRAERILRKMQQNKDQ
jgi:hypothetical protein